MRHINIKAFVKLCIVILFCHSCAQNHLPKMKFGFDLHGVIDKKPELFANITKALIKDGHKVYIITGLENTEKLHAILKEKNISYTDIFSITSYHKTIGTKVDKYDKDGNIWINEILWNKTKSEFCAREKIDLHFDDSDIYLKYFTTSSARVNLK